LAGAAALTAGAFSMAAGEYVSVSSQADTEAADLAKERQELAAQPAFEREELANLYVARGVELKLARQVADQLMAKDALGAHARDELGISEISEARPIQAALTSAATFSAGALVPLAAAFLAPKAYVGWAVSAAALIVLAILGAVGARAGGASVWRAVARVTFWGALALGATAGVGALFGVSG
jgi:VIT1/CCC1 family predicted Fe2+/Mn2+ transporter